MTLISREICTNSFPKVEVVQSMSALEKNWNFRSDIVPRWMKRQCIEIMLRRATFAPSWIGIKPATKKNSWAVYFLYLPVGTLTAAHIFTLSRLKDLGLNIFVVCATKDVSSIPPELHDYADALYWKALNGYDFSAYTLALRKISQLSSGANVFVMNDSTFGPFSDIRKFSQEAAWDLTGFTASSQVTSHIQSYAFILKNVNRKKMRNLASVFFPFAALSLANDVIALQETRLARVAARSMTVGAFWFAEADKIIDPTLVLPIELLGEGFPFLKRSLLGKHKKFQNTDSILSILEAYGHPPPDSCG